MLYDLSLHFDLNMLALHLENSPANLNLQDCALKDCIREVLTQTSISLQKTQNFLVFTAPGLRSKASKGRKHKLELILSKKQYPKLQFSYHQAPLQEILSRILEELGNPLDLANGLQGRLSLHLNQANAFEVLFHIAKAYRLRVIPGSPRPLLAPPSHPR
jgi:hypothetical protein